MRLYIRECLNCRRKIYLTHQASTRNDLRSEIGNDLFDIDCLSCGHEGTYSVDEVCAESNSSATGGGAVAGGLVGLLGGPLGLIIGAVVGGAVGASSDGDDIKRVNTFNNSF
jgi:uncharacterized membrane protein